MSIAPRWSSGSGKRASGPARSTRDQAVRDAVRPPCRSTNSRFASGGCERMRVAMSRTSTPVRLAAARAPRQVASTTCRPVRPFCDVEQRRPADLHVADVARRALSSTRSPAIRSMRLRVLHQRDREVERAQQLGLVVALLGRDEGAAHPGQGGAARRGAASPGDVERRVGPERAVEVEVELRLGHRPRRGRGGHAGRGRSWRDGRAVRRRVRGEHGDVSAPDRRPRAATSRSSIPMSTILVTGASGLRRQPPRPGARRRRPPRARARPRRGRRPRRCDRRLTAAQRDAGRDADRATSPSRRVPAGRPRRRRRGPPPRRPPARLGRRRDPPPGQHRGHAERAPGDAGRRASGGSSTSARWASSTTPTLHYASTKAKAIELVRASGLDWTVLVAVADVRAARRVLQHPRGAGPDVAGRRADHRHRRGAVPAAGGRRPRAGGGGDVRRRRRRSGASCCSAGRATGPTARSSRRSCAGWGSGGVARPDAGAADPARGGVGRGWSGSRSRSRPTSCASSSSTTSARSTGSRQAFGFEPAADGGRPGAPPRSRWPSRSPTPPAIGLPDRRRRGRPTGYAPRRECAPGSCASRLRSPGSPLAVADRARRARASSRP